MHSIVNGIDTTAMYLASAPVEASEDVAYRDGLGLSSEGMASASGTVTPKTTLDNILHFKGMATLVPEHDVRTVVPKQCFAIKFSQTAPH